MNKVMLELLLLLLFLLSQLSQGDIFFVVVFRNKGGRTCMRLFSYIEKDNFKAPVTIVSNFTLDL